MTTVYVPWARIFSVSTVNSDVISPGGGGSINGENVMSNKKLTECGDLY